MGLINNIEKSRKTRVFAASFSGIAFSLITLILSFVLRTVFIKQIGVEFLGLFSFLSELLGLLTAVDGGICSSLFIKIHKPIAQNDPDETAEIFRLIRIVYTIRALVVLLVGLILFFFLPYLADDVSISIDIVKKTYMVYLLLNAFSYLFVFYQFVLEAYQKRYLTNSIHFFVTTAFTLLNIAFLYLFSDFYVYIVVSTLSSIGTFVICDLVVRKNYKYLYSYDRSQKVNMSQFKDMLKITYYTLSSVLVKNTDNILVTKMMGFRVTGLYSTYKMLNGQIFNLISKIKYSAQDSTRNYIASNDYESSVRLIDRLTYAYFWISGFCSICLACLSTPFIRLWLGDDYILPMMPVFLTVTTLFLDTVMFPMDDAFYSTETYRLNRTIPIVEVCLNLGVSIVLGLRLGITGVMIGTLSYLVYKAFARTHYMYNKKIGISNRKYLINLSIYTAVFVLGFLCTNACCMLIKDNTIITFIIRMIICTVVPLVIFYVFTSRMEEYSYFKGLIYNCVRKRRSSKKEEQQ